jgi:rRNA maturation endonuclease Nob1
VGGDTVMKAFTKYKKNIQQLYRCSNCGDEFTSYQDVRMHCRKGCGQQAEEKRQETLNFI